MNELKNIVKEIDECMERVYQKKPDWRPLGVRNEHPNLRDRPFNFDICDEEFERIMEQELNY